MHLVLDIVTSLTHSTASYVSLCITIFQSPNPRPYSQGGSLPQFTGSFIALTSTLSYLDNNNFNLDETVDFGFTVCNKYWIIESIKYVLLFCTFVISLHCFIVFLGNCGRILMLLFHKREW